MIGITLNERRTINSRTLYFIVHAVYIIFNITSYYTEHACIIRCQRDKIVFWSH